MIKLLRRSRPVRRRHSSLPHDQPSSWLPPDRASHTRRRRQQLVQPFDLGPHLNPELCIKVRERFSKEENLWITHDRPSHCDALALTAGQLTRAAAPWIRLTKGPPRWELATRLPRLLDSTCHLQSVFYFGNIVGDDAAHHASKSDGQGRVLATRING